MSLQEFALDPSGTKRVQIFQGNDPSNITVLVNRSIIGTISDQEELASGKELTLKDGSIVLVRYANNTFVILKDGQPLPTMSAQEIAVAEARMKAEETRKQEEAQYQLRVARAKENAARSSGQTNSSTSALSGRSLGPIIATVGALLALLAFFAMPYLSAGPLSISAVQAASGNISGFQFGGQPFLWLEMLTAGILIVIAIIQVVKSLNPAEYISGGTMSGMIALAVIALLFLLGKYFLFDTQPTILGTNLLGNNITVPPISSFYGSGYWVYIVSLVITIVGGGIALKSS